MTKLFLSSILTTLTTTAAIAAAPSVASPGVFNSASYISPSFPNGGVAQGSIFVVFGSGLGPATIAYNSSLPYQTTLSGTSVSATVSGTTVACLMFYTSAGQIAAILPSTTPTGTGTLTVTYNGATSSSSPITVVKNAMGLFTRNQQGSGPAVIQDANGNYNSAVNAFQPGQTVTFWGTGLGPISGSDATTPTAGNLPGTTVTANIGGQNAVVQYAGRSGFAGEDQINVTIPSGVSGCYVPVYMTVNGVTSNFVTMSVATTGSVCSDANLYTSSELQNIANGTALKTGNVILEQQALTINVPNLPITLAPEEQESGTGTFSKYDPTTFLSSFGGASTLAISQGCAVYQFTGTAFTDPVTPTGLDAGPAINVTGPNGTKQLTKSATGQYSAQFVSPSLSLGGPAPTKFLTPGDYTLDNGSGGTDVGAFKVNVTVPQPVTWSNKASVTTVPRSQSLTVNWTGGASNALVYVVGISPLSINSQTEAVSGAGEFVCVAPAPAGTLTVPSSILSVLPPSANISQGGITIGGGIIILSSSSTTPSTVPGLDDFSAGASSGDGKIGVTFQ
jgi:uncharacterized protein (TIGR03437 family)